MGWGPRPHRINRPLPQLETKASLSPPRQSVSKQNSFPIMPAGPKVRTLVIDSMLLALIAAALIYPLFTLVYMDNWASIEATFIADGRFLAEHWPHPRWQPLWYGGTRFDYIYPPALRYGTAGLSMLFGIPPAHAYHIYTAFFYCIGIAGVYLMVRALSGSRGMAWAAALATMLVSPTYWLMADIRVDAATRFMTPWRLHVLALWGEGPHTSALALIGPAIAASWLTLTRGSRLALVAAAVLSALVVSNNFYGGVALAIFFGLMVWGLWVTRRDHTLWLRGAATAALAYGLTAYWLVPSYLTTTLANLKVVRAESNIQHLIGGGVAVVLFFIGGYWWGRERPERFYALFLSGAFFILGGMILSWDWFGIRIVGTPGRLIPELDLVLTLGLLEIMRHVWNRAPAWSPSRPWLPRAALILPLFVALPNTENYLSHAWDIFPEDHAPERRIEYRLSEWMARNLPDSRAFVAGSVRFWYNAWHDLGHLSGGSHQGILNQSILPAINQIRSGPDGELAAKWAKSFGVDAIIVNDETSAEFYDDYPYPKKFEGVLPVLRDEGNGDVIYRVPRRYPGHARVVRMRDVDALSDKPPAEWGAAELGAYVRMIEQGPDEPAVMRWVGSDRIQIGAEFDYGEALMLQVAYDPSWRAYAGRRRLPIHSDPLGQMLVVVPEGRSEIQLVFHLPLENAVGRILTAISIGVLIWVFVAEFRRPTSR